MKSLLFTRIILVFFGLAIPSARADNALITSPAGTNPDAVAVNPITNKIYVVTDAAFGSTINVINGATNTTVPVTSGSASVAVAVNPATNKIYVANQDDMVNPGSVTVIDGSNNTSVKIPAGLLPSAVAVNPVTNKIYVTNKGNGSTASTVLIINGTDNSTGSTAVGVAPIAVTVNPVTNRVYVLNQGVSGPGSVSVIDGATDQVLTTVNAGIGPAAIAVNPVTDTVYLANSNSGNVMEINGTTNATVTVNAGVLPSAIAINPVTNEIYVPNKNSGGTVTVIDGETNATTSLNVGSNPAAIGINVSTNKIYVANSGDGTVSVIDGATTQVTGTLNTGTGVTAIGINPLTNAIYAVNEFDSSVTLIDGGDYASDTVRILQSGTGGEGFAVVNPVTDKIYVAEPASGQMTVIDGETNETSAITTGTASSDYPNELAVNPITNKAYVAIPGPDTVSVIDGDFNDTQHTSSLVPGTTPLAIGVNPATNAIYIACLDSGVTVLDGATNAQTTINTTLRGPSLGAGISVLDVAVNTVSNEIYVSSEGLNTVTAIDGAFNDAADTDTILSGSDPQFVAINPVTNKIYATNYADGTVSVIDGAFHDDAHTTIITVGNHPGAIAVNPITNLIYVCNAGDNSVSVIDGAFNDNADTITIPTAIIAPNGIAIDAAINKIYIASGDGTVYVLDGATEQLGIAAVPGLPGPVAVNPVTHKIYATRTSAATATVITPSPSGSSNLATLIQPLPGNAISGTTATLHLSAASLYGPVTPPVRQIYYQLDTETGPWTPVTPGSSASATLSGLQTGMHTLYAFATDGQEATSTGAGSGSSPILGQVSAYAFGVTTGAASTGTGGSQFYFAVSSATVRNADGTIAVTVQRNFNEAATVDFQSMNGTATAGINFTAVHGTLTFATNETSKTINVPILEQDSAPGIVFFSIQLSNPSGGGSIGNPGNAGVFILNGEAEDASLSQTAFTLPTAAPAATDSISVALSPGAADGQWRLFGELTWRNSGDAASGLTDGDYEIEFKTADGYQAPEAEVVPLAAGEAASLSGTYIATGTPATGGLEVTISPAETGGWRLQGETAWRASGETATGLNVGDYIIEFEPAAGLATPENVEASVQSDQTAMVTTTYLVGDATTGAIPLLVSDSLTRTEAPYLFTGQIQTDEGFGSGFVPINRVVVTAAHVLFDDGSLSFVTGVRWFFQYEQGVFETPPQVPRGCYVLAGYAAQRAVDNSPGVASVASRQLDAAALYFLEPAARGGQSGYLASNTAANPWLTGTNDKFIAGYPMAGVSPTGRLYATPVVPDALDYVAGSLFNTTALTSFPGNSGGPLFARFTNGNFYPAAIYLGGSEETIVRGIDSQVIDLMNRAEVSGTGGATNSGEGISEIDDGDTGAIQSALGSVSVMLQPAGAIADGAYWELAGDSTKRFSNQPALGLAPGAYTVQFFTSGHGYSAPAEMAVAVTAGNATLVSGTYAANAPTITSANNATAIAGENFSYQITTEPGALGYTTTSTLPTGLRLNPATGLISGVIPTNGVKAETLPISLQATNGTGTGSAFTLELTVGVQGELILNTSINGAAPKPAGKPTVHGVGSAVSITAPAVPGYLFESWTDIETGFLYSTRPAFSFTMPGFLDLQANYVTSPFTTAKGTYFGLLQGAGYAQSGFAQVTVTAKGSFTATINLGGRSVKLVNSFNNFGLFQGEFLLPDGRLFGLVLFVPANGILNGTLTGESDGSEIALNAERPEPQADHALAGAYTVVLPAASGTAFPAGNGFGTLIVTKTGGVKFAGKLGDGTPVTVSGALDSGSAWPFLFMKPAGKASGAELLLGSITLPPGTNAQAGVLNWYRTASTTDPAYPGGFSTPIAFETSRYTAPPVSYTTANATFSGASIAVPIIKAVTIDLKDRVTYSGTDAFTLKFTAGSGLFTGSFLEGSGAERTFNGALLQSGNDGLGLFQDANGKTGSVLIKKTP